MDNALSTYWHSLEQPSPGKRWFYAPFDHPSVYRAIGINPSEGSNFALAPFRPVRIDDVWLIAAAWPTPRMIGARIDEDWLGISHVILWNPKTNSVSVEGDVQPQIVGRLESHFGEGRLFGQPRAFFQAWAIDRARFFGFAIQYAGKQWQAIPDEPDLVPGALVVGGIDKVRINPREWPEHVECVGIDPKAVNRAVMRAVKLPRVTGQHQTEKKAA